jgi:hypothetical protein
MSLVDKVAALRLFFGVDDALELLPAIASMTAMMGIVAEGAIPQQVDHLIALSGVKVGTARATPAGTGTAQAAAPQASRAETVERRGRKRKADAPLANSPLAKGLQTLFTLLPDAKKTKVGASELLLQRERAIRGEDYSPMEEDMRTFKSERGEVVASPSVKKFQCDKCPRSFPTPQSLHFHRLTHAVGTMPKAFEPQPDEASPLVAAQLQINVAEDGTASLQISLNGEPLAAIEAQRVAGEDMAEERADAVRAEAKRRQRLRDEAEAEGHRGERRQGSGKRIQYTAKEIVEMIEIVNRLHDDESILNKGTAWNDKTRNPKFYGVAFSNTSKWRKADEHRRQLRAASRAHASTLLRIDKESRKKGRYAGMEKELFGIFKARRARGRKASAHWLTHTARHLMKQSDDRSGGTAALSFKGGYSWRRHFRARWGISIRKKTNCKNTTWEETKPVLLNLNLNLNLNLASP